MSAASYERELERALDAFVRSLPRSNPKEKTTKLVDEGMESIVEEAAAGGKLSDTQVKLFLKRYKPYVEGMAAKFAKSGELLKSGEPIDTRWIRGAAPDITQEVMLRTLNGGPKSGPVIQKWDPSASTFATFLGGVTRVVARAYIAKNIGTDEYRERTANERAAAHLADDKWRDVSPGALMPLYGTTPKEMSQGKTQVKFIEGLELSPKYEEILSMRASGASYQQMAEILQIPLGTVMTRLYRARKRVEDLTGIPLSGLVGTAAAEYGLTERGGGKKAKGKKKTRAPAVAPKDLEPAFGGTKTFAPIEQAVQKAERAGSVVRRRGPAKPDEAERLLREAGAFIEAEEDDIAGMRWAARKNPGEVWIYFETYNDVVDLFNEGLIDDEAFDQCVEALDAHGFV